MKKGIYLVKWNLIKMSQEETVMRINPPEHIYAETNDIDTDICFVCGKILTNGQTVQELTKFNTFVGNMCSKKCVDNYWIWWDTEYHRIYADDFEMEKNIMEID